MPIPLGILAAAGRSQAPAGAFQLLESTVLTGSQASVEFTNLTTKYAATYQHLQIRYVGQATGVLGLQFNTITTNSYRDHRLYGFNGSTGSDTINTDRIYIGRAGEMSPGVIDILDPFETTKNKTVRTLNGDLSGTPIIQLISGAWFSTNSVTSIRLFGQGNWAQFSRFSLYGIKATA